MTAHIGVMANLDRFRISNQASLKKISSDGSLRRTDSSYAGTVVCVKSNEPLPNLR